MIRSPLLRSQPSRSAIGTPIAVRALTARGVRPSPQTFSLGNRVFSSSNTSRPALARWNATDDPAGPAPTTITSAVSDTRSGTSAQETCSLMIFS